MLLTETIKNSTNAIKNRRATLENKQHAETYAKALSQLSQANTSISKTLDCIVAMKQYGIVENSLMDNSTKQDLLNCINDCGNAISDRVLALDTVRLLQSKGDAISAQIKVIWKDSAKKYSEATKGYLSLIGSLSDNPQKARILAQNIDASVNAFPSVHTITDLVNSVSDAKIITDSFSLSPPIEVFLKKISSHEATVNDLTPEVLSWLTEKNIAHKVKLIF